MFPSSSPIGEVFRARLRQFPSLVTCSTIDWFSEWPTEALQSVANALLDEIPELDAGPAIMSALVRRQMLQSSDPLYNLQSFHMENRFFFIASP